tara:strand:+ start:110761 stop:110898 length:138 start_codon:yes stop_codon:yes gene_type:complete
LKTNVAGMLHDKIPITGKIRDKGGIFVFLTDSGIGFKGKNHIFTP